MLMFEMLAGRSPFDVVSGNEHGDQSTEDYLFQGTVITSCLWLVLCSVFAAPSYCGTLIEKW